MKKTCFISLFIMFVFSVPVITLHAEDVSLEASAKGQFKMNIGLTDISPSTANIKRKPPYKPEEVLASDLALSSRFKVIRSAKADTALFKKEGAGVYLEGYYYYKGDEITVEMSMNDARKRESMVSKRYSGDEKSIRRMMHRFADEVVMYLFGEKGIAQTQISYVQVKGKAKELSVMDYDGFGSTSLTNNGSVNILPSWSPDRKEIVFISFLKKKADLYIVPSSGGSLRPFFVGNALNSSPEWSKIENKIVFASSFSGNTEIYTKDADGTDKPQRLTNHWGIDCSPAWSPTGYEIAFTSDRNGGPQIFIMDNEGGNVRRVSYSGKYNDQPAWSPKGDRIAYVSSSSSGFNIFTVSVDGREVKQLTSLSGDNEFPSWSPDGKHVTFSNTYRGKSDIFIMNDDGSERKQITFSGNAVMPSWSNY